MSDRESLFGRLRQRRVVRGAIAHVIVAWLFVQVADVVLPYLGIVDEPVRWALVISVATFPVTLFIAWLSDSPWSGSGHPLPEALALVIVAVVAGWWVQSNLPQVARERTSIVVMPFEHEADHAYLASALSNEIASLLMRSKSIDVIAPESANSSLLQGLGSVAIAGELKVANVLVGSVAASDDTMRIVAELKDGVGEVIWSMAIEESIAGIADVQLRIAAAIESRLGFGEDSVPVAQVAAERCWMPTDVDALKKYFAARHLVEMRTYTDESRQQIAEAIETYKALLDTYPDFAEARTGLAWAYVYQKVYDESNEFDDPSEVASMLAAEALEDCATLGEAMHLMPNEFKHENFWIGRWQQLTAFIEMEPHKFENYQRLARLYRNTGLDRRALEVAERLVELNPMSVRSLKELAFNYQRRGRYEEAKALFARSIELGNTAPNFAETIEQLDLCGDDIECLLDNLFEPHRPYKDQLRVVYRTPSNDIERAESLEVAMQLFEQDPDLFTNWLNDSACGFEHLTPLFFELWDKVKERGNVYWHWANVWGEHCIDVHSSPQFPAVVEEVGFDEYWHLVEWPDACQPRGDSFACGRNVDAESP